MQMYEASLHRRIVFSTFTFHRAEASQLADEPPMGCHSGSRL